MQAYKYLWIKKQMHNQVIKTSDQLVPVYHLSLFMFFIHITHEHQKVQS